MSNLKLPSPPVLKTTIIQLNKELDQENGNFEILTNDYNHSGQSNSIVSESPFTSPMMNTNDNKKKRRRSTNVNEEELAKRKIETKQLHSIIEKRRRVKINREFEALKYLIPACRNSKNPNEKSTNNNSKIDGMYKLTILKSSVEYILYLHHLIEKQQEIIKQSNPEFDFDLNFTKFPLNVNEYRNIDQEFSFKQLYQDYNEDSNSQEDSDSSSSSNARNRPDPVINEDESFQLPSPIITPDMPPNRFRYNSQFQLPDPALVLPQKKYFKTATKQLVMNGEDEEKIATKTLLSLRKNSIDNLLN